MSGVPTVDDFRTRGAHQSRLRCEMCCGVIGSWRDCVMVTLEGGTAAGAIYALLIGSTGLGAGLIVTSVALCGIHGCWRRDAAIADLTEAADDIEETGIRLTDTAKKTEKVVDKIRTVGTEIGKGITGLQLVDLSLDRAQQNTASEIVQLNQTNQSLLEENAKIIEENTTLRAAIEQLKELIKKLNQDVEVFNVQNERFKKSIEKLSKGSAQLELHEHTLEGTLVKVDHELDQDMVAFAEQIAKAKASSHEIFTLLAQQNQILAKERGKLKEAVDRMDQSDGVFAKKTEELQGLEKQTEETRQKLEALEKEYEKVKAELGKAREQFTTERGKLEAVHRDLDKDQSNLHQVQIDMSKAGDRLEQLGDRWSKTLSSLGAQEKTLQLQILELGP